jgi:hypothetical protein
MPTDHEAAPPLLGEYTEEILTKVLGYSAKDYAEIKRARSRRRRSPPRRKRRNGILAHEAVVPQAETQ